MSALRMYSDMDWVSWNREVSRAYEWGTFQEARRCNCSKWRRNWKDGLMARLISIHLSMFNFRDRSEEVSISFSRRKSFTIKISTSSLGGLARCAGFSKLAGFDEETEELRVCIHKSTVLGQSQAVGGWWPNIGLDGRGKMAWTAPSSPWCNWHKKFDYHLSWLFY